MRPTILVGFAVALTLFAPRSLAAKDFPESVLAADPLAAASSTGAPAGLGGAFEYANYLFAHDDVDSFYLRSSLSPVFFDLGGEFALGGLYETDLFCGPVGEGQTAANVAAFWMNALQFEYGLYASARLPTEAKLHFLAEYSRTSQHPLLSGNSYDYSQVAADILMLGLSAPELELGEIRGRAFMRFGYRDLFGFWQSGLPRPRVSWILRSAVEARSPLGGRLFLVARAYPDLFIDRYKKDLDGDFFAEFGLAFAREALVDEFLLTCYGTRDSDLLADRAHPTFEAGILARFALARL